MQKPISKRALISIFFAFLYFFILAFYTYYAIAHIDDCQRIGYEEARLEMDFTVICIRTERMELP